MKGWGSRIGDLRPAADGKQLFLRHEVLVLTDLRGERFKTFVSMGSDTIFPARFGVLLANRSLRDGSADYLLCKNDTLQSAVDAAYQMVKEEVRVDSMIAVHKCIIVFGRLNFLSCCEKCIKDKKRQHNP